MKPSAHEYILLMEDLAEANVGDQLAGCTHDEAELAIRSVASLHAHYWGCEMSQPLAWVPKFGEIGQDIQDVYQQRLPIFR